MARTRLTNRLTTASFMLRALARTLISKDLTRAYEFFGKELIVKSSNPDEHWRASWEHY